MKKILTILLTCFLLSVSLFVLTACGGGKENSNDSNNEIINIYNMYVAYAESNGNTPVSYEEWLKSIKGDKGDKGDAGQDGKDGQNGKDGQDGVGIEDIDLDENGNLVITFTDGTTKTLTLPEIGAGNNDEENTELGTPGLQYQRITGKKEYSVVGLGIASELDIIIPSTYNGLAVTSIGDGAFENCDSLTSIEIPNSVTSIGDGAFENCESLTNIEIPDSVTSIGDDAFSGCNSLRYNEKDGLKYLGNSNNKYLYLAGTVSNEITTAIIDVNCKFIGYSAFFNSDSLTSIEIPNSVTSIGNFAFNNCYSLETIKVDGNNTKYKSIDGNLYSKDGKTLIRYTKVKSATSFLIPDSVTSIGDGAFNCCLLTSIEIPNSVTSIGDGAFLKCEYLTSIEIPASVTSIGNGAFDFCFKLTSIVYGGTKAQWKEFFWIHVDHSVEIECIDGII